MDNSGRVQKSIPSLWLLWCPWIRYTAESYGLFLDFHRTYRTFAETAFENTDWKNPNENDHMSTEWTTTIQCAKGFKVRKMHQHYTIIDWWWGQHMICWTFRQNVARGRRPRATFCLKVQHIICCPNPQSIIVLLYLPWFRIKYSIQTIHKQTDYDQTASIWTNWFGTN